MHWCLEGLSAESVCAKMSRALTPSKKVYLLLKERCPQGHMLRDLDFLAAELMDTIEKNLSYNYQVTLKIIKEALLKNMIIAVCLGEEAIDDFYSDVLVMFEYFFPDISIASLSDRYAIEHQSNEVTDAFNALLAENIIGRAARSYSDFLEGHDLVVELSGRYQDVLCVYGIEI